MNIHYVPITGYLGAPKITKGRRGRAWPSLYLEVEVIGEFVPVTLLLRERFAMIFGVPTRYLAYRAESEVVITDEDTSREHEKIREYRIPAGDVFHAHPVVDLTNATVGE